MQAGHGRCLNSVPSLRSRDLSVKICVNPWLAIETSRPVGLCRAFPWLAQTRGYCWLNAKYSAPRAAIAARTAAVIFQMLHGRSPETCPVQALINT